MTWKQKTWYRGGGDMVHQNRRLYRYSFSEKLTSPLCLKRTKLVLPFETKEVNTNGDAFGHFAVLQNPDFHIRGNNVMEWAKDTISKGWAEFVFEINGGSPFEAAEQRLRNNIDITQFRLQARFSDRGIASLFKLTFG